MGHCAAGRTQQLVDQPMTEPTLKVGYGFPQALLISVTVSMGTALSMMFSPGPSCTIPNPARPRVVVRVLLRQRAGSHASRARWPCPGMQTQKHAPRHTPAGAGTTERERAATEARRMGARGTLAGRSGTGRASCRSCGPLPQSAPGQAPEVAWHSESRQVHMQGRLRGLLISA